MTEIDIPMNAWSLTKLGLWKVATSRTKRYGVRGDTFTIHKPAMLPVFKNGVNLRFEILEVVKLPLWYIIEYLYVAEGADDAEELKRVWKDIHPSFDYEKDRDKEYWVHMFKELR